ncbi:MAG TPA: flagellar hook-basal body protein [Phycisphaerae bacterium]|nr:flagellar hook-basal body protein [Phycisphaerae bacterium]
MTYGLWLSAGGMQVNEYRQSIMANNLANVDTVGFKHNLAVIHERRMESAANPADQPYSNAMLDKLSGGMWVKPTYTSFNQGALEETGRALDLALEGNGFFTVSDGQDVRYTRDGRLLVDQDGTLRSVVGEGRYRVLDAAGQPIVLDRTLGAPVVGKDGAVMQGNAKVAQLGLVDFADHDALRKTGAGMFQNAGTQAAERATPMVHAGHVERSTMDPITGMVDMIEVSRAYQLNAQMVSLQDTTLGEAVSRVGRIN